jgi:small subunit ribosomal protein S20
LANTSQSRKRVRQAETHRQHNAGQRSEFRTAVKKTITAAKSGDKEAAEASLAAAIPAIDRAASRGLIHKNKAARHKSRLSKLIHSIGQSEG